MADTHPKTDGDWLSAKGNSQCSVVRKNGRRCRKWCVLGSNKCRTHGKSVDKRRARYRFKTQKFNDLYEQYLNDPDRLDMSDELSLAKMCVQGILGKINKEEIEDISTTHVGTIMELVKTTTEIAERCNRIEKGLQLSISLEHMKIAMDNMVGVIAKYVDDEEVLENIIRDIAELDVPIGKPRAFEEGEEEEEEISPEAGEVGS